MPSAAEMQINTGSHYAGPSRRSRLADHITGHLCSSVCYQTRMHPNGHPANHLLDRYFATGDVRLLIRANKIIRGEIVVPWRRAADVARDEDDD